MIDSNFWKGRSVFLTGHTGFKGSWLALWLQMLGAKVTGLALDPPSTPSLFEQANVSDGMRSIRADIRDERAVADALATAEAEVVLHLAAQSLVRRSYANPVETYSTNVVGTACVLEAVRRTKGVRAVVVVTSDKCYENREWVWGYRESDVLGGHDPYSSSKACTELVASAYRDSYFHPSAFAEHGVAIASARAGNVIGGGDWAEDRLLPDLVRGFSKGERVSIRNPMAIRPWQHVLEPLAGYLELAERLCVHGSAFGEAWNFGPTDSDARSVAWVADYVASAWGGAAEWRQDPGAHPHEARTLLLDCTKAVTRLSWRPRWAVTEALDHTLAWYRVQLKDASAARLRDEVRRTIEDY